MMTNSNKMDTMDGRARIVINILGSRPSNTSKKVVGVRGRGWPSLGVLGIKANSTKTLGVYGV